MVSKTAVIYDLDAIDGRASVAGACRHAIRLVATHLVLAMVAMAAVALLIVGVTLSAAWIVNRSLSGDTQTHVTARSGPATLALGYDTLPTGSAGTMLPSQWARRGSSRPLIVEVPQDRVKQAPHQLASLAPDSPPASQPIIQRNTLRDVPRALPRSADEQTLEHAGNAPLPARRPAEIEFARAPAAKPATQAKPQIAVAAPPQAEPVAPALSGAVSRTAVYDIAAHTVYMPDGQTLEAHSGLGNKRDNPRYTKIRMRGPTPPNVYDLTMREKLFHGVRAVRLNPVDERKMYGRDGMLAHTYMLGPNGQSNGCVSFKDYNKFLTAFLDGKVDRMVVVPELGNKSWRVAAQEAGGRKSAGRRYAANTPRAEGSFLERIFATR